MTLAIFGIRHHGVGCSRALVSALNDFQPDAILVEGPPEGKSVLQFAASKELIPPVAIIVYPDAEPIRAAIYPFAEFSPEWVAARYANSNGVPIDFIDLPVAIKFGLEDAAAKLVKESDAEQFDNEETEEDATRDELDFDPTNAAALARAIREDPLATLARIAGEESPERWEERAIEQASTPGAIFPVFLDAMTELRVAARDADRAEVDNDKEEEKTDASTETTDSEALDLVKLRELAKAIAAIGGGSGDELEPLREAAMRRAIRAALKNGFQRIAVVCGAWHAPTLDLETTDPKRKSLIPKKSQDDAALAKLPKVKTSVTWIPWTYSRLARRSGYGAGIESPAWLNSIWQTSQEAASLNGDDPSNASASTIFLANAARALRGDAMNSSAANVVDAARFADALAALRDRSTPSLDELRDAIVATLCRGERAIYASIKRRLEIGDRVGSIPSDAPSVPLAKEIERERKRLRLKLESFERPVDLDLREDLGRDKSRFFRRLEMIGAPWATPREDERRALGTFRETWTLAWRPELEVAVVDASRYGATLLEAASNATIAELADARTLGDVMSLVERATLAELNDAALVAIYAKLRNDAATSRDVNEALDAIPSLARLLRYGAARGCADPRLTGVFDALFERVVLRMREICVNVSDETALETVPRLMALVDALQTLEDERRLEQLFDVFERLALDDATAKRLVGRLSRALYDRKRWSEETLVEKLTFFISRAAPSIEVAEWLQGFLAGTGQSILWLDSLWRVFDKWLADLDREVFLEEIALLRRAFDDFSDAERRALSETIANLYSHDRAKRADADAFDVWDSPNARALVPIMTFILAPNHPNAIQGESK